ncbi:MAG: hypothetical protein O2960_20755 [Verrucomicrobia bacterium]|nr:hypothetical protein [Verrucomicrobiota bacterium]
MNKFITRFASLAAILCGVCLGSACGNKEGPSSAEDISESPAGGLPGADVVMAAISEGDYKKAISSLAKIAREARPEQKVDFMVLKREVNMKLLEAAEKDPKANEALEAMRVMSMGR